MTLTWLSIPVRKSKSCAFHAWRTVEKLTNVDINHVNTHAHIHTYFMFIHTHCSISHAWNACVYAWRTVEKLNLTWFSTITWFFESCHDSHMIVADSNGREIHTYVVHMNESCHTYGWVMSHVWMSHVTHMNASCHTYRWVMSSIINQSCLM